MAKPLIDRVLLDARTVIADRARRLRCTEAVTAGGDVCAACDPAAVRFCAVGALNNAAFRITGDHEHAHRLGWKVAGMIAAVDALINQRRAEPCAILHHEVHASPVRRDNVTSR